MKIEKDIAEALRAVAEKQVPPADAWLDFEVRRRRAWLLRAVVVVAAAGVAAAAIAVPLAIREPDVLTPIRPTPSVSSPSESDAGKPVYFEGAIHGWEIGPDVDRSLDLDCTARRVGAGTATDLDFKITYMPKNLGKPAHPPAVEKWICGGKGLSVTHNFDWDDNPYEGIGTLRIERAVYGARARSLYARPDLVEPCTVAGHPAICVHYEDDSLGRGPGGTILVIEDDVLDPFATALVVTDATGIPFDELLKIAAGIR